MKRDAELRSDGRIHADRRVVHISVQIAAWCKLPANQLTRQCPRIRTLANHDYLDVDLLGYNRDAYS
jgi:hypothetical protein